MHVRFNDEVKLRHNESFLCELVFADMVAVFVIAAGSVCAVQSSDVIETVPALHCKPELTEGHLAVSGVV